MADRPILDVQGLTKSYPSADGSLTVLKDITFSLRRADTCAILGPSGSGKTTLLGLCAGLDEASAGRVCLDGMDLRNWTRMAERSCAGEWWASCFRTFN